MTALFALIGLSLAPSPQDGLTEAERNFAAGVAARHDAEAARSWFAKSARNSPSNGWSGSATSLGCAWRILVASSNRPTTSALAGWKELTWSWST